MKIIIYAMTNKSKEESTSKDIDEACVFLEKIMYFVDEKLNLEWVDCKGWADGTMVMFESNTKEKRK